MNALDAGILARSAQILCHSAQRLGSSTRPWIRQRSVNYLFTLSNP